jgi:hypothetical protein
LETSTSYPIQEIQGFEEYGEEAYDILIDVRMRTISMLDLRETEEFVRLIRAMPKPFHSLLVAAF